MNCPGCGLPNYEGLCPVCRADETAYMEELYPYFGEFYEGQAEAYGIPTPLSNQRLKLTAKSARRTQPQVLGPQCGQKETKMKPTNDDIGKVLTLRNEYGALFHGTVLGIAQAGAWMAVAWIQLGEGSDREALQRSELRLVRGAEIVENKTIKEIK